MVTKTLEVAVQSTLPAVEQFDAIIAEQLGDITKSADMLVSVEKWEGDIEATKAGIASVLYGVLISQGEPMTLGWFDVVRVHWLGVYNTAKGGSLTQSGLDNAWSRAFKLVYDAYGLTKPKAETKDAEKKAVQRAKQAEKLAAYEAVPVEQLQSEVRKLFDVAGDIKNPNRKEAKKQADDLVKVIDAKMKASDDAIKEELKNTKAEIKELLKDANDIEVLYEVLQLLQGASYDMDALL
jgi:hypothetical protein